MVLGLGYILAFNDPNNPLEVLYGTFVILAICNVYHYHAQGYLIATTSINQISRVFDEASTSLGGGFLRTLWAVTLPIISPSIISVGVFYFVRSMVTLSAVIFLVTPETQVAAVSVLLLDDAGNQNQAAAFSVCIMLVVAVALIAVPRSAAAERTQERIADPLSRLTRRARELRRRAPRIERGRRTPALARTARAAGRRRCASRRP